MSKKTRDAKLASINKAAISKSGLSDLTREYTLEDIAWITRAGTAKCLGLTEKGHLGIGADGDVAVYRLDPNEKDGKKIEDAFSDAAFTIKAGTVVALDGEIVKTFLGNTIYSDVTGMVKKDMMDSVIDDIKAVMSGMLSPESLEKIIGLAEVKDVFRSPKFGDVAGSIVIEGVVRKGQPIRVLRENVVIYEGELESLRRALRRVDVEAGAVAETARARRRRAVGVHASQTDRPCAARGHARRI